MYLTFCSNSHEADKVCRTQHSSYLFYGQSATEHIMSNLAENTHQRSNITHQFLKLVRREHEIYELYWNKETYKAKNCLCVIFLRNSFYRTKFNRRSLRKKTVMSSADLTGEVSAWLMLYASGLFRNLFCPCSSQWKDIPASKIQLLKKILKAGFLIGSFLAFFFSFFSLQSAL